MGPFVYPEGALETAGKPAIPADGVFLPGAFAFLQVFKKKRQL